MKRPKCILTEEYKKKLWNITQSLKNEIMSFGETWMDLEIIILSEVNQTEKDKYYIRLYTEPREFP